MGLPRLILLAALAAAAYWLWKKVKTLSADTADERLQKTTQMVRCVHCNLHLPQDDAIRHNNQWYCSKEHVRARTGQS